MYVYMYMYIYVYLCVYVCIYILNLLLMFLRYLIQAFSYCVLLIEFWNYGILTVCN